MNVYLFAALVAMPIVLLVGAILLARKVGLIKPVDKSAFTPKTGTEKARDAVIFILAAPFAVFGAFLVIGEIFGGISLGGGGSASRDGGLAIMGIVLLCFGAFLVFVATRRKNK